MSKIKIGAIDTHYSRIPSSEKDKMMDSRTIRAIHRVSYGNIAATQRTFANISNNHTIAFYITRNQCDLISELDLVLPNPDNIQPDKFVHEYIQSVTIEIGGHRFDKAMTSTQLLTTNQLFKRYTRTINNTTFIPLSLAPFHKWTPVPPSTTYHDFVIFVEFKKHPLSSSSSPLRLCGLRYWLQQKQSDKDAYEFITHQQQNWGPETIKSGVNRIQLNLNNITRMIYFWGFDKTKVTNIRFLLDDEPYYEGTIEELEHYKCVAGYPDLTDPTMIVFSNESFDKFPYSAINFSVYDKAVLEIETTEENAIIDIVGISINQIVWSNGMMGMKWCC